jgi:hypothetical protein
MVEKLQGQIPLDQKYYDKNGAVDYLKLLTGIYYFLTDILKKKNVIKRHTIRAIRLPKNF